MTQGPRSCALPYSERLTGDGLALHAGDLPGHPSSRGRVHRPPELARLRAPKAMSRQIDRLLEPGKETRLVTDAPILGHTRG